MKKFRLITLLGTRPDLIRFHKLIDLLDNGQKKHNYEHIFVHSGQHYDLELFNNFLQELKIRQPDINFDIGKILKKRGKTTQAYQSALLFEKVDELIKKLKPNAVMYLGDTNTVTSALIVAKNNIPVIHIEAGGRSFDWRMPEEKNRIIIDHLSDSLYCYLERYKELLLVEGIAEFRIKVIGNIIVDALKGYMADIDKSEILEKLGIGEKSFILITIHREENVESKNILENKLTDIARFAKENNLPAVFPVMPRVDALIKKFGLNRILEDKIFIIKKPLGFFDFSKLEKTARLIVTDSGTVQEDALILGVPCVVTRYSTERPETVLAGATILEGIENKNTLYNRIREAFNMKTDWDRNVLNPEGGSPSERVFKDLMRKIKTGFFEKSRKFEFIKSNKFVKQAYKQLK